MDIFHSQDFLFFSMTAGFTIFIMALLMVASQAITVKDVWKKRCKEGIIKGLTRNNIDWKDVTLLAERWGLNYSELRRILLDIHYETFCNEKYVDKKEMIKNFVHEYDKREPFSDLPKDVKIQLNKLMNDDNKDDIRDLASSLSEYNNKNQRNIRQSKMINFWSFVIGIVGVIIGILGIILGCLK